MAHGADRYRSRRNRSRVRELFWREWDPIGINNNEQARDEYDRYADRAYVLLMDEGKPADEIAAYLYWVACEYMGLGGDRQLIRADCDAVAQRLVALRPALEVESNERF
jgi:hypothetical protein